MELLLERTVCEFFFNEPSRNKIVWIVTDGATDITALKKVLWQI
jgi:hypothetical protein